jgi:predicted transcriptional regulator
VAECLPDYLDRFFVQFVSNVPNITSKDFIDAWKQAERGKSVEPEYKLNFDNLEILLKTLTSGRWILLKTLHKSGPMSIRALANKLTRDYKNVHTDVRLLENVGLTDRTEDNKVEVPWSLLRQDSSWRLN